MVIICHVLRRRDIRNLQLPKIAMYFSRSSVKNNVFTDVHSINAD